MLTDRQAQILRMFLAGMTYREIAVELDLSTQTINPSLRQSAKRLGASGIARETLRAAVEARGERLER